MARALRLARRGMAGTTPNPRVGCVLVKDGAIIGEGWHEFAGGPHAEVNALSRAVTAAAGCDCYVTLEPCSHSGKTPPCTEALIGAAVSRVIAAMPDPNPRVSGRGFARLQEAGIRVESGLLETDSRALNPGFIKRMTRQLPYVRCKLAMSLDGRTALDNGESKWITGTPAREDVQRLRSQSCAVMTGSGTVLADDPRLDLRGAGSNGRQPLRVVLDRRLRFPETARMLRQSGRTLVFTLNPDPGCKETLTAAGAQVIVMQTEAENFSGEVLRWLAREEQVNEILLEAGAVLSGGMLRSDLIDELIVYQAPLLLGNAARGLFDLPPLKNMKDKIGLELLDLRQLGRDLRLTLKPQAMNNE